MSLDCFAVRDFFVLYHDRVLSPETELRVDSHLCRCKDCRRYYRDMERSMRSASPHHTAEPFHKDLDFSSVAKRLRHTKIRNIIISNAAAAAAAASGVLITCAVLRKRT